MLLHGEQYFTSKVDVACHPEESSPEPESAPEEDGDSSKKSGIDLSLKDIFEETASVDENLKDLADSQEDIRAEDLAGELKEFLSELER